MSETEGSYNEAQGGYRPGDAAPAPDVQDIGGACPPMRLWFRIYPEIDFSAEFANPPANVIT